MMQDWRSYVVRQIPVNPRASPGSDLADIDLQHIVRNHLQVRELLRQVLQSPHQRRINLNRGYWRAGGREMFRHLAVARTDLDPAIGFVRSAIRRNGKL